MIPLGKYRHFKGNEYEVIGIARHSETQEPHVVYRPLYEDSGWWVRPLSMFTEMVQRDGVAKPRFEWIGQSPGTASRGLRGDTVPPL